MEIWRFSIVQFTSLGLESEREERGTHTHKDRRMDGQTEKEILARLALGEEEKQKKPKAGLGRNKGADTRERSGHVSLSCYPGFPETLGRAQDEEKKKHAPKVLAMSF